MTVTTGIPTLVPGRRGAYLPFAVGAALVVVMAVLPLLNIQIPGILPGPTYTPGTLALLSLCMVFAALALSYNLLLGTSGMLSFGHALYFGAGAYGLGLALKYFGVPLWPGVLIALVGGLAIAAFTGAISMRVSGIPFAMVTLAFAQAGSVLVRRNQAVTGGEEGLRLPVEHVPEWLVGVVNTRNLYWLTLVVLVVVYLVVLWVDRSRLGHLAQAARENELRVQVLGLRPYTAKLIVFVVAALCASLAGIAYMLLQSGTQPSAVGADQQGGVREGFDGMLQPDLDPCLARGRVQQLDHPGAVDGAEILAATKPRHVHAQHRHAVLVAQRDRRIRRGHGAKVLGQAQRGQDPRGVGADLDAGADLAELARAFQHRDPRAALRHRLSGEALGAPAGPDRPACRSACGQRR